ncbi:MAG: hypothetical protein DME06_12435 [Candidatus Rokuibacteriota bacterium]|nr:MAG: hypothetical protein DME06_12435 [Candidatus Rokubacteria bacterium]
MITIEIQGLPSWSALRARVAQQLTHALRPLGDAPVRAKATFVDGNGPRHGVSIRKYRERRTERRRRPKKYYVAKRLLAEGLPPELVGGPRRPAPEDG